MSIVRSRRTLAIAAIVAASGCTLLRPVDYLTNGPPDASSDAGQNDGDPSDGANPMTDAVADAAASDGESSDAPLVDAGPDAPWCLQQANAPFFCADFDEGALTAAYSNGTLITVASPQVDPGCEGTLVTGGLSAPGAFSSKTPAVTTTGTKRARIVTPLPTGATNQAKLSFDMKLVQHANITNTIASMQIANPDGGAPVRAFYTLSRDGVDRLTLEGTGSLAEATLQKAGRDVWARIEMTLTIESTTVRAKIVVAGQVQPEVTNGAPFATGGSAGFDLGSGARQPSDPLEALFDNVVFTDEP